MDIALIGDPATPAPSVAGPHPDDLALHGAELARALGHLGHRVTVFVRRDDLRTPTVLTRPPGVCIVPVDAGPSAPVPPGELSPYLPEFGRQVGLRWLSEGRPDVVHAIGWRSGVVAAHAARIVPAPRVQTFAGLAVTAPRHGAGPVSSQRLDAERALARDADAIVATSRSERAELWALGADPERIDVVPWGVDLHTFAMEEPTETPGRPRIVAVTRPACGLGRGLGLDVVLRALPMLPGAEFVVAGGPPADRLDDDPEARRLHRLAADLGVQGRFELRGPLRRAELAALLGSADVVACTPDHEPVALAALQAMACGRPVVASAVGALLDTVRHGVTGYHVPPRDPRAAVRAIEALLTDVRTAAAFSAAGREIVERRHGWRTWRPPRCRRTGRHARAFGRSSPVRGDRRVAGASPRHAPAGRPMRRRRRRRLTDLG